MANLFFMYRYAHNPKAVPEYFEIGNPSALLTEWRKMCGSRWAHITQVQGIPPGCDWFLVDWDSVARSIRYQLRLGTSSGAAIPPALVLPPKYMNQDTGQAEERMPAPPPRRDYNFTCRSKTTGLLWEGVHRGADLIDLVRGEQQRRPDHVIISIEYKGDSNDA